MADAFEAVRVMSDDVAAVLAVGLYAWDIDTEEAAYGAAKDALGALTAAGYAIVKLPEGVAVAHGARLVDKGRMPYGVTAPRVFSIEDTP